MNHQRADTPPVLWHGDGDQCIGIHCGNPEHGWAAAEPAAAEPPDIPIHTAECQKAMYRGPHVCICGASQRAAQPPRGSHMRQSGNGCVTCNRRWSEHTPEERGEPPRGSLPDPLKRLLAVWDEIAFYNSGTEQEPVESLGHDDYILLESAFHDAAKVGGSLPACQHEWETVQTGPESRGRGQCVHCGKVWTLHETADDWKPLVLGPNTIHDRSGSPRGVTPALDVPWANAALAADARGWRLLGVKEHHGSEGGWIAIAGPGGRGAGLSGRGRTPNAALDDLAARLGSPEDSE